MLFDLGGVLHRRPAASATCAALSGITSRRGALGTLAGLSAGSGSSRAARCTPEAFASGVVEDWGLALEPADFLAAFADWTADPYPGAPSSGRRRGRRVPIGCLSNTNPLQWETHYEGSPLLERFRLPLPLLRARPGEAGPGPSSTTSAQRLPRSTRRRALFLDDNVVNVEAAAGRRLRGPPRPRGGRRPPRPHRERCARRAGRLSATRPATLTGLSSATDGRGARTTRCARMPPWLPTAPSCASCPSSVRTSPSSGRRARTACSASCTATRATTSSTRPHRCAGAACRAIVAPQAVSGRGHLEIVHRELPAVDPGQRPLHRRLGLHRRAARRAPDHQPGRRRARATSASGMPVTGRLRARRGRVVPALHPGGGGRVSATGARSRSSVGPSSRASASPTSGAGSGRSDLDLTIEAGPGRHGRRRADP